MLRAIIIPDFLQLAGAGQVGFRLTTKKEVLHNRDVGMSDAANDVRDRAVVLHEMKR